MAGDFLWNMRQQRQIAGAGASAASARQSAENAQDKIGQLQNKLDGVTAVVQAMWHMLREQHNFTEEELMKKISEQIDKAEAVLNCPKCDRVMSKNQTKCMYCGEAKPLGSFVDAL